MSHEKGRPDLGISSGIFPSLEHLIIDCSLLKKKGFTSLEIGYEHVGPALQHVHDYQRLLNFTRMSDQPLQSLHAPYRPDRDISLLSESERQTAVKNTIKALDLAVDLKIPLVVLHASESPIEAGERQIRCSRAHRSLSILVEEARDRHIRIAVEFLPPEWLGATLDEMNSLVEDLDSNWIGCCLDTNHANLSGDLVDIVHGLNNRLWHIHISDNDGKKQQHWMPLQGVINWREFMKALAEVNYVGPLVYELDPFSEGSDFALDAVRTNFDQLMHFMN